MVYLVGAGPGDPGLITVRGAELLAQADVVIYDGLASAALLELCPPSCVRVYAGKKRSEHGAPLTQDEIDGLLIDWAGRGGNLTVVRLKGGDPFVFGRGGEEAEALAARGLAFEVVPGVSAATAVPAYAGIPLTHRDLASTAVLLATGQEAPGKEGSVDWAAAAKADTLVLFMGVTTLGEIAAKLVAAGRDPATPAAAIRWGTTPAQRTVVGTLGDLAARVEEADLRPPATVIIGDVVRLRERIGWFERRPLFGRRVLIPRSPDDARPFAKALAALGAEPVTVEVTRIEPIEPNPLVALLATPLPFDWLALTSRHAVLRLFAALDSLGRDVRALAGIKVAAVGAATAEALARRGLRADLVPAEQTSAALAAALPATARILFPRAQDGRDEVARLPHVTLVPVYRTVAVPDLAIPPVDIYTFFAPSQVDAVLAVTTPRGMVCAIGPSTAAALRARGVEVDVVPASPTAEALAHALAAHYPRPLL